MQKIHGSNRCQSGRAEWARPRLISDRACVRRGRADCARPRLTKLHPTDTNMCQSQIGVISWLNTASRQKEKAKVYAEPIQSKNLYFFSIGDFDPHLKKKKTCFLYLGGKQHGVVLKEKIKLKNH